MKRNALIWSATGILAVGVISSASARPPYLQAFKAHYNTASGKPKLNAANCALCHIGPANQAKWNAYGEAFRMALGAKGVSDQAKLVAALKAAETKQNAAARQTFGQLIAKDEFPATAQAAGGTPPPATGNTGRPGPAPVAGDWEPAFNGVDMTGLTKMNQGNWVVENQVLKYTGGGNGWLRTNKQYKNYSAVIVWRFVEAGPNDAGIFLKAPALDGNPFPQSPQLFMGGAPANYGGISGTQGASNRADLVTNPLAWNTYQVTVSNGMATLSINGQKAWDKATGLPNVPGYVGFQNEGRKFEIAQFWIRPLN